MQAGKFTVSGRGLLGSGYAVRAQEATFRTSSFPPSEFLTDASVFTINKHFHTRVPNPEIGCPLQSLAGIFMPLF